MSFRDEWKKVMKQTLVATIVAAVLIVISRPALAAPISFTGSYSQNFDSMGTAGTAAPAGWAEYGLSGSHDQFRFAGSTAAITTTVLPSDFSDEIVSGHDSLTLTKNPTLTAATPTNQRLASGFNFGLAASPNDRALGASPTGVAACELELGMINNTGAPISTVNVSYDIRRFSTTASNNSGYIGANVGLEELPGSWLFYSLDGGTNWNGQRGEKVADARRRKTGRSCRGYGDRRHGHLSGRSRQAGSAEGSK
jgi:hypothetical protein